MTGETVEVNLQAIKAISEEKRLRILRLLSRMDRKICVCEVMKVLEMPQHEASKSLKQLKDADFIVSEKIGRFVYYRLNPTMNDFCRGLVHLIEELPENKFKNEEAACRLYCGNTCSDCDQ